MDIVKGFIWKLFYLVLYFLGSEIRLVKDIEFILIFLVDNFIDL